MKILPFCDPFFKNRPLSLAIGVFDGFHIGHKAVVNLCLKNAAELNAESCVILFSENPKMKTGSGKFFKPLISRSMLYEKLEKEGVNYVCIIDFSEDMSKLTGRMFLELLHTSYDVVSMTVGSSFRCGCRGFSSGPDEIRNYFCGSRISVAPDVLFEGSVVSSTLIRNALLEGRMQFAASLLGEPYCLDLRNMTYEKNKNGFFFEKHTIGQMLPREGSYNVKMLFNAAPVPDPGPMGYDTVAVISERGLDLKADVCKIPDQIQFL